MRECTFLFQENKLNTALHAARMTNAAAHMGLDRRRLPENIEMTAYTTVEAWVCGLQAFMAKITCMVNDGAAPICIARYQAFDETSLTMRRQQAAGNKTVQQKTVFCVPKVSSGSRKCMEVVVTKTFQLDSILQVTLLQHNRIQHFRIQVPSDLVTVDHATAEATMEVLEKPWGRIGGLDEFIWGVPWLRRFRLFNCDRCASNIKCLDNMACRNPAEVFLRIFCHVHMVCTSLGHAFAVCTKTISGMIAASLAMNVMGMLASFQALLALCLQSRLRIIKRPPPRGGRSTTFRDAVLNKVLGPKTKIPGTMEFLRRRILETYLNGDWSRDVVEHFCDSSCCSCGEVTHEAMFVVAWALLPSKIPMFPRHRWTGAEATISAWQLLAACHNLLPAVMPKWCEMTTAQSTPKPDVFSLPTLRYTTDIDARSLVMLDEPSDGLDLVGESLRPGADVHDIDLDADWARFQYEDKPEGAEDVFLLFVAYRFEQKCLVFMYYCVCVCVSATVSFFCFERLVSDAVGRFKQQQNQDWAAFNKRQRKNGGAWAASRPGAILTLLLIATGPFTAMMHALLDISGTKFLAKLARNCVAATHSDATEEVRMLDASNVIETCSTEVNRVLAPGEHWDIMRYDWRTFMTETLAYRVLARGSGSAQHLLRMRWTYPTKLFWLLRYPEFLQLILEDPPCLWDDFTREHMRMFRDRLLSKESIAVLLAAAILLKVDICLIECRHACIRRIVLALSHQCHASRTCLVNAIFALAWLGCLLTTAIMPKPLPIHARNVTRDRKRRRYKPRAGTLKRVKCRNLKPKRPRQPGKTWRQKQTHKRYKNDDREHRGGGAWKVFVSDELKGRKGSALQFRRLSAAYWKLSPVATQELLQRGAMATNLARQGRSWTAVMQQNAPATAPTTTAIIPDALAATAVRVWEGEDLVEKIPLVEIRKRIAEFESSAAQLPVASSQLSTLEGQRWRAKAEIIEAKHCPAFVSGELKPEALPSPHADLLHIVPRVDALLGRVGDAMLSGGCRDEARRVLLPIEDAKLPRMKDKPKGKPLCQILGRCMCSSGYKLKVAAMEAVFIQQLRDLAAPHSPLRKAIVGANIIIRFITAAGNRLEQPWMHISYMNMSTFMYSCVKLHIDQNVARLCVAARVRGGVALQRLQEDEWQDPWAFFESELRIDQPYSFEIWHLTAGSEISGNFDPSRLAAKRIRGASAFWRGTELDMGAEVDDTDAAKAKRAKMLGAIMQQRRARLADSGAAAGVPGGLGRPEAAGDDAEVEQLDVPVLADADVDAGLDEASDDDDGGGGDGGGGGHSIFDVVGDLLDVAAAEEDEASAPVPPPRPPPTPQQREPPPVPLAPPEARPRASRQRDGRAEDPPDREVWFGHLFSQVRPNGVPVGWGVRCGLHWNGPGDPRKTCCQTSCSWSGNPRLSDAECILRLKRWVVLGLQNIEPDDDLARWKHVHQFKAKAQIAGMSAEELDAFMLARGLT